MNVTLFKELSDASSIREIPAGVPLCASFEGLRLEDYVILVNGEKKTPDYIPSENDIIAIRSIPHYSVVAIVFIALAVGAAAYTGYQAYQLRKQAEEMEEKMKNLSDEVLNTPYLQGARNSLAKGKTQPYVIGEHFFTPYVLQKGYRKIAGTNGKDQYYYIVLQQGFNFQVLRKLSCGDVTLRDFGSGTTPQEGVYAFDEDSVFYDADSLIEIAQDGNAFTTPEFNERIDSQEVGDELKKSDSPEYETLTYTLPETARSFTATVMFRGLRAYATKDGAKIARSVIVVPAYSLNGGDTWTNIPWTAEVNPYMKTGNTSTQMRFNITKAFTWAEVSALTGPILVKFDCLTPTYDGNAKDEVYIENIQSKLIDYDASVDADAFVDEAIIDAPEAAVSTLVGLKIKATTANEKKLDSINCISSGMAKVWTGSAWSAGKTPTSNPASWLLEVLTSHTHNPSKKAESEIDLDSLGELYEYCEDEGLTVDLVLTDGDEKKNLLATILNCCYAAMYRNVYGKVAFAWDGVKENAIAVLNTQNLIDFSWKKDLSRLTDGIKITYTNRERGYVQDTYLVMRQGVTRSSTSLIRDMTVVGTVSYDAIVKQGRRLMAIEELRPKDATAKIGKEGAYYAPLEKVLVQHPSLRVGLGDAEIKSLIIDGTDIIGLTLYDPIEYDSSDADGFGVIMFCVNDEYATPLTRAYTSVEEGRTTEIYFVEPIALSAEVIPHMGNILSYGNLVSGSFEYITTPMLITKIETDDTGYVLSLVDYNEAIYDVGDYPDYVSHIINSPIPKPVPTDVPPATSDEVSDAISAIVEGTTEFIPADVGAVTAIARQDVIELGWEWDTTGIYSAIDHFAVEVYKGSSWALALSPTSNRANYAFDRDVDGYPTAATLATWRFRVKAVNIYGYESANYSPSETGQAINTSYYLGWAPVTPSIDLRVNGRGISLGWGTASEWYGEGLTDIQIARGYTVYEETGEIDLITDLETLDAYAPAIGVDPRASYDNYREGAEDGYLSRAGSALFFSVPLYGQNEDPATTRDTPYYVRLRSTTNVPTTAAPTARTLGTWTDWELVYGQATNAQDVVRAWTLSDEGEKVKVNGALGAYQIYAEFLSAITSNLGVITDGAMVGNENNLWALSRIMEDDGVTVRYYEGTVKMGGTDQYLHITPITSGGLVTGYNIDFKVGNFTVTAIGSVVNGKFEVRNASDNVTYFSVDPTQNGLVEIKNMLTLGPYTSPASRLNVQEAVGVGEITFTGTGTNDMQIVEDGEVEGDIEVEIVYDGDILEDGVTEITDIGEYAILAKGASYWLLIGCEDTGQLYKSTNQGASWIAVEDAVFPNATNVACGSGYDIITTTTSIYKSIDSAVTFSFIDDIELDIGRKTITITGTNVYILSRAKYVVSSADSGDTWSLSSVIPATGTPLTLFIGSGYWLVGDAQGKLIKTTNSGSSWTVKQTMENILSSITMFGADLYVSSLNTTNGRGSVWRSTDDGESFTKVYTRTDVVQIVCIGTTADYIFCTFNTAGIAISTNGTTWTVLGISMSDPYPYSIIEDDGVLAVASLTGKIYLGSSILYQTFRWRETSGAWSDEIDIIKDQSVELTGYDIFIAFSQNTGHVAGDLWAFSQQAIGAISVKDSTGTEYFSVRDGQVSFTGSFNTPLFLRRKISSYTSTQVITLTTGAKYALFYLVGAGGGGGSSGSDGAGSGGGGGGGGFILLLVDVAVAGDEFEYVRGGGALPSTTAFNQGATGGTSSIAGCIAYGGTGGFGGDGTRAGGTGGSTNVAGVVTGVTVLHAQNGDNGTAGSATNIGGNGGGCTIAISGDVNVDVIPRLAIAGVTGTTAGAGTTGTSPFPYAEVARFSSASTAIQAGGGGGAGATTATARLGGVGAGGVLMVVEYFI